ncbi:MAG: DUF2726 domain-containing protein [Pseudomonadota bacterium]
MLKRLTNQSEHRVFEQVAQACDEFGAEVYRKIRVADVIDIEKCSTREIGTFALMSHFDFVVTDEAQMPLFAIEFDGSGHDGKNDWKKDALCQQADLALFRVNFQALDAQLQDLSFLAYLVHTWFMAHVFKEMRESGQLPPDEPFMIWGFLKPDAKHIFDSQYNFTGIARGKIQRLVEKHKVYEEPILAPTPGHLSMAKDMEKFACFACINIKGVNIFGSARMDMRIPCFGSLADVPFGPIAIADFCDGLAHRALADNLSLYLEGAGHTLTSEGELKHHIRQLRIDEYRMLHGGGPQGHALSDELIFGK